VAPAGAHGDLDLQIAAATREIQRSPNDERLYLKRAELHLLHAQPDAALTDLAPARRLDPAEPGIYLVEGRALLAAGRFAEARPAFDRFLTIEPNHPIALWFRARTFVQLGRRELADADLRRCLEVIPQPGPELHLARAGNLEATGDLEAALQVINEGIESRGPVPALQLAAVDLETTLRRYQAAARRLDGMIADSKRPAGLLTRKAAIQIEQGDMTDARDCYLRAREFLDRLSPSFRNTAANRALAEDIAAGLEQLNATATNANLPPLSGGSDS
jgi:tetratricopeptide (TPR) repeat protein